LARWPVGLQYDVANRLLESTVTGGDVTTYEWDAKSRLITTTVAGNVSRVYQYSQNGNLVSADVDGLLTTFTYDGRDNRRRDGLRLSGLRQLPGGLNGLGWLEQERG
jgi:YD repeat-containing protein